MLILIPAAGAGSRFRQKGLKPPKPLIQVRGRTLLEYTLESFHFKPSDQLIIAVQREHGIREALDKRLKDQLPEIQICWFELDAKPPGQLATSAAALHFLLTEQPNCSEMSLMIHNCDTGFKWNPGLDTIESFASMPVFQAKGDHWSFGKANPVNPLEAIEIAEKRRISELASIGLYGFITANAFHEAAEHQLSTGQTVNGEHYIAPMLQAALREGKQVSLPRVSGVRLYGTPKELMETFGCTWQEVLDQNT